MRLVGLRIGRFWGDRELRIDFSQRPDADPGLAFLVGANGAGKSRALEALGRIFSHLWANEVPGMDFDVEYELGGRRILISSQEPALADEDARDLRLEPLGIWLLIQQGPIGPWRLEHVQQRWPSSLDEVLPARVIGLSTGPASRLDWALNRAVIDTIAQRRASIDETATSDLTQEELEAYRHEQHALRLAELRQPLSEPRCVALSGAELRLAVLALLSHPSGSGEAEDVRSRLLARAGMDPEGALQAFTFDVASNWRELIRSTEHDKFEALLGQARTRLVIPGTALDSQDEPPDPDLRVVFGLDEELRAWIQGTIDTPLIWFDSLLSWLRAEALLSVRLVFRKAGADGLLLDDDFSDGEFLLVGRYGLLLLLRGAGDSLVLFDEPETHFNDRWKISLVEDLAEVLAARGGSWRAQVAIATHSDLTLTDADRVDVYVLDPVAGVRHPPVSPFAADREQITMRVMGADRGSGTHSAQVVDDALESGNLEQLREALDRTGPGYDRFRLQYALHEEQDGGDAA